MNMRVLTYLLVFLIYTDSKSEDLNNSLLALRTIKNSSIHKKIALVYKGPGSCLEGCSEAAAKVANMAGFTSVFVGPEQDNSELFKEAAIWIQPGGESITVSLKMNKKLKKLIQKFVFSGGAYVGFCAGGFLATEKIDNTYYSGFGLIKAKSRSYDENDESPRFLDFKWNQKQRKIYWEGGPYFVVSKENKNSVHILAEYSNGASATIASYFGKGTVIVTGGHPEAPKWWADDTGYTDADGIDNDLAVEMILKATKGIIN